MNLLFQTSYNLDDSRRYDRRCKEVDSAIFVVFSDYWEVVLKSLEIEEEAMNLKSKICLWIFLQFPHSWRRATVLGRGFRCELSGCRFNIIIIFNVLKSESREVVPTSQSVS